MDLRITDTLKLAPNCFRLKLKNFEIVQKLNLTFSSQSFNVLFIAIATTN